MNIIVNGDTTSLDQETVTYADIVRFAGKAGHPTVTYRGPQNGDSRRMGEMHHGCVPVKIEDGMIFTVIHTGNS